MYLFIYSSIYLFMYSLTYLFIYYPKPPLRNFSSSGSGVAVGKAEAEGLGFDLAIEVDGGWSFRV